MHNKPSSFFSSYTEIGKGLYKLAEGVDSRVHIAPKPVNSFSLSHAKEIPEEV